MTPLSKQSGKDAHPQTPFKDDFLAHMIPSQPFILCLFASPPVSAPIGPLGGKSVKGVLFTPIAALSTGLFKGCLKEPLFAIGLMPPGAPILLVASNCGFTIFVLGPGLGATGCVEPGTCLRSRVKGLEVLWSIPGVLRMEGDSA